jgi:hypothetical protein
MTFHRPDVITINGLGAAFTPLRARPSPRTGSMVGSSYPRVRSQVNAEKARLRRIIDQRELADFQRTAAVLAARAEGASFWSGAITVIAFLEIAAAAYPDSAWLRGNAQMLMSAVAGDSVTQTGLRLRAIKNTLDAEGRAGMSGLPAFEGPTVMEDDTGLVLSYSRTPEGVLRGGFSRSHARWPWAWTLGTFALGWAGGYLAWVWIGKRR